METQAVLPNLDHFTLQDADQVYEPAEDTFLLCDAIKKQQQNIELISPQVVLEIGCGSGCVITYIGQLLNQMNIKCPLFLATDVNKSALVLSKRTSSINGVKVEFVQTDLVSGLEERLYQSVDILIFNPPYVPTEDDEIPRLHPSGAGIEAAWAGGEAGRKVIDRFLPLIPTLLSPRGCVFLVLVAENRPREIDKMLREMGFRTEIVLRRRARNEDLMIMYINRETTPSSSSSST